MGLKLSRSPIKKVSDSESPDIQIRRPMHASEILPYLEEERSYSASAIAHLEPDLLGVSKWFIAENSDNFSLCLISRSTMPTYLLTLGDVSALNYLLGSQSLPGDTLITCQPQHMDTVKRYYDIGWHRLVKRMVVSRKTFMPATGEATRLEPGDIREINQLYLTNSGYRFSARQIREEIYYGTWRQGQLIAIAGTHIISPSYGIARVGNVLTHPAYRNQGLATICTSAVTERLFDFCTEVVLDVEPDNLPAIRAYTSLGYQDNCFLIEALGRRKSFMNAVMSKLGKKLGF